ncbi:hypothetical protein NLI96_g3674 [Meripilus lineatus]|uniref:Uncharacterized protein n=1 Tax=Meripilus lineatus TaxID=2056292 RepID=A0AAD5V603_9APHY|nr:hypothetical protein NLI96_g3674 [Physisporinus lineatus]
MGAKRIIIPNTAQGDSWLVSVMPQKKPMLWVRVRSRYRSFVKKVKTLGTLRKKPSQLTISRDPFPNELKNMILAFLEADLQEAQASIVHDRSIFRNEGEGRPYITTEESNDFRRRYAVILDARRPIRSLALVSRSWYQASTPFLYARPFLFGIDQLQSLRKTVCDRHKEIADFVKHPVMIFRRMNKTEYDFRPLPMVAERPIMTFKSVLSIQCACKNLSSLTIEIPSQRKDGRPLQNGAELFLEGAEGASIKNPASTDWALSVSTLSNWHSRAPGEQAYPSSELPTFLVLHTIHIANSSIQISQRPRRSVFTAAKFPQLRNLTLENNEIQQDILHDILLELELDRLLLFGSNETDFLEDVLLRGGEPDRWGHVKATLHGVTHLTLKHDPQNHRVCMRLLGTKMRKLETLTYFVDTAEVSTFSTRMVSFLEEGKDNHLGAEGLTAPGRIRLGEGPGSKWFRGRGGLPTGYATNGAGF